MILLGFAVWFSILSLVLLGTHLALSRLRPSLRGRDIPYGLYPVTILKPVKGLEPGLRHNLESFFQLDYPEFEILFTVTSESDPCTPVIRSLIRKYSAVKAELLIGDEQVGLNPKVNNLFKGYQRARFDWILISDSNTWAPRDFLRRLVAQLDSSVGVLTCVIAARGGNSWGGWLEKTFLNSFYARWMFVAPLFGRPCVVGKAMMLRKTVAEKFGGLATLGRYLAEDYKAGEIVRELGYRVVVSRTPVIQPLQEYSIQSFWKRHLRWGHIRKAHAPWIFLVEPLSYSWINGLIGAWALSSGWGISFSVALSVHLSIWAACDVAMARRLEPERFLSHLLVWLVRELSAPLMWAHILLVPTIEWRGTSARIRKGGEIEVLG